MPEQSVPLEHPRSVSGANSLFYPLGILFRTKAKVGISESRVHLPNYATELGMDRFSGKTSRQSKEILRQICPASQKSSQIS